MPVFPSDEWLGAFCDRLEAHPDAGRMARALDGVYRFVIEPGAGLDQGRTYDIAISPDDGSGARVAPPPVRAEAPRLTITARYDRWVQLLRGELDIPLAVLLRRIRVSGDLGAVTGNLSNVRPLLDTLSSVDSTFVG